jgi:hypothetical protein
MDKLTDWTVHNFYKVSPTRKYVEGFHRKTEERLSAHQRRTRKGHRDESGAI